MLSEPVNRDLEESVQLRMKAIRGKISLALTFFATVETEVRCGRHDKAERFMVKLCATIDYLQLHMSPFSHLPETFLVECLEQLTRLEQRVSLIKL